jgi:hypothetical protein
MPKKKTAAVKKRTAWTDGDEAPDSPIVQTMHVEGITYQRKFIACGKLSCRKGCASGRPSHGPYWYAIQHNPKTGKTRALYVGKQEPSLTTISKHVTEEP